jgi:hypothetical protein
MMNKHYIYVLFRPWNGEPFYVGKGKGNRLNHHAMFAKASSHYNKHVEHIYHKAKRLGLTVPAIIIRNDLDETQAFEIEMVLIRALGRLKDDGPLANLTDGGEGVSGYVFEQETIDRIVKTKKDRGIRAWNLGLPWSDDVKTKFREAKIGVKQSDEHIEARTAPLRGRKRPPEFGAAITAGKTGKLASEETKAILKAANRSRQPDVRALIAERTREAMRRPDVIAKTQAAIVRRYGIKPVYLDLFDYLKELDKCG